MDSLTNSPSLREEDCSSAQPQPYITCSAWQEGQGHDPILQGFSKCQTSRNSYVVLVFIAWG